MIALSDQDVLGLDVAMDQPGPVRGVERIGDLSEQAHGAPGVERVVEDQLLERGPRDQAHGQEQAVVALAGLVDRNDVLVVERRLDLPFALEASPEPGVVAEVRGQQLEGDHPLQGQLGGLVDRPHATLSEYPVDAIPGNDRPLL